MEKPSSKLILFFTVMIGSGLLVTYTPASFLRGAGEVIGALVPDEELFGPFHTRAVAETATHVGLAYLIAFIGSFAVIKPVARFLNNLIPEEGKDRN